MGSNPTLSVFWGYLVFISQESKAACDTLIVPETFTDSLYALTVKGSVQIEIANAKIETGVANLIIVGL